MNCRFGFVPLHTPAIDEMGTFTGLIRNEINVE